MKTTLVLVVQWLMYICLLRINVIHAAAPIFETLPSFITVNEDFPINGTLLTLRVTDSDPGDVITVAIGNSDTADYVTIIHTNTAIPNDVTVTVKTKKEFDRDVPGLSPVRLAFTATDATFSQVTANVDVYIVDVNDNDPEFRNEPYRWDIRELPFEQLPFELKSYTNIYATDPDNGNNGSVKYSLKANTQSTATAQEYDDTFSIDINTGHVTLNKALDYEKNTYYQFNVMAKDGGPDGGRNSTTALIIRVLDVQDTAPFFTGIPYRESVDENIAVGTSVISVTARDGDPGLSNLVNYTIILNGSSCANIFSINSNDGTISTALKVDRDSGDIFDVSGICILKIMAKEINNSQIANTTTTTDVTITINDKNDNAPSFGNTTYTADVHENTARNVPITILGSGSLDVRDTDQSTINAEMTLSLKYPNDAECRDFTVSPTTVRGEGSIMIRVNNTDLLDYEHNMTITFLVIATEKANISHVATATVVLNILDMNDNNPQFDNSSYTFYVPENSPDGTFVGNITATDADSGEYGNVSYSISGGNNRFVVDKYTGKLYVNCDQCKDELDMETRDEYQMTYTATDLGGRSNATSLIIHLMDVNDNTPTFSRPVYSAYLQENDIQYNTTPVLTVEATDRDQPHTNNSAVRYSITSVSDSGMHSNFTLHNTSGELLLNAPIDFEKLTNTTGTIQMIVTATDLGTDPLTSNCTVTLHVQDVNDHAPIFNTSQFSASIREDARSAPLILSVVGGVTASDSDGTTMNSKFNYFIESGANDRFTINSMSGNVSVQINAKLDRETDPSYNITILAIDQGSPPLTGTTSLIVTIVDVNDELPVFNKASYAVAVLENTTSNDRNIITCYANDSDEGNKLNYSITAIEAIDENGQNINSTDVHSFFGIHPDNGTVYIMGNPDRETAEIIILTILVEDTNASYPRPQNATTTLRITITDINDNYPKFEQSHYNVSISENANNPVILDTFIATDKDKNRTMTYRISASDAFQINNKTGVLSKTGHIDREINETIDLVLTATDNGVPPLSTDVSVTIHVLDFNDNGPVFPDNVTGQTRNVTENATNGTEVIMMLATDIDIGPNQNITYAISGDEEKFKINTTTGMITVIGSLDREIKASYRLSVMVYDNPKEQSEQKSSQTYLTIRVVDINDNEPMFEKLFYFASVLENVGVGSSVITITASDLDEPSTNNSRISYSIANSTSSVSASSADLFSIDATTGTINVNSSLGPYVGFVIIDVIAEDHGDPMLSNNTSVNITIRDVNLHKPAIGNIPQNNTIKIYECAKIRTEVYTFNYTDGDHDLNAEAFFNISVISEGDNVLSTFEIQPNGVLRTKSLLNFNLRPLFTFQVQATDKGEPALSSDKLTIVVEVIDVDSNLPTFSNDTTTKYVSENRTSGEIVGAVTAIDEDHDSIACYSIEPKSTLFEIGKHNGSISTTDVLDRENVSSFSITVNVKDCSLVKDISEYCENQTTVTPVNIRTTTEVTIVVKDVNDNPPKFRDMKIITGMKRVTEVGATLNLQLKSDTYITDKDEPVHGISSWTFENNGAIVTSTELEEKVQPMSGTHVCADNKKHVFCITGNGSIINNKFFNEDMSGYFTVPIKVTDDAGTDYTDVTIYLISDSQILIMTVFGRKEVIAETKDKILELYSNITGHLFVYDAIMDHKTPEGMIDTFKTDLHFHVVERQSERILSAQEALGLVDRFYNALQSAASASNVMQIVSSTQTAAEEDDPTKTIYILAAVIIVLALTVIIIIYVSFSTRSKYQRKLKAATTRTMEKDTAIHEVTVGVPGSNQYSKQSNPLLNAEIKDTKNFYDNISLSSNNSIDSNAVDEARPDTVYDTMEEREVVMDMFTEDTFVASQNESPLDAALKLHEELKEAENRDNCVEDVNHEHVAVQAFLNHAFNNGELESSDI